MSQNESKLLIITGSSRPQGNTQVMMKRLGDSLHASNVNLSDYEIGYYDYEHKNQNDDFLTLAQKMVDADVIVLGSPVYWYSVSAQMKVFIDRWSDLLTIRKDLGRALKGKRLILVSCGSREEHVQGFALPIEQTVAYMGMKFIGYFHSWIADDESHDSGAVSIRINQLIANVRLAMKDG